MKLKVLDSEGFIKTVSSRNFVGGFVIPASIFILSLIFSQYFWGLGALVSLHGSMRIFIFALLLAGIVLSIVLINKDYPISKALLWGLLYVFVIGGLFVRPKFPIWGEAFEKVPWLSLQHVGGSANDPFYLIWAVIIRNVSIIGRRMWINSLTSLTIVSALLSGLYIFITSFTVKRVFPKDKGLLPLLAILLSGSTALFFLGTNQGLIGAFVTMFFLWIALKTFDEPRIPLSIPIIVFALSTIFYPPAVVALPVIVFLCSKRIENLTGRVVIILFSILPYILLFTPDFSELFAMWSVTRIFGLYGWLNFIGSLTIISPLLLATPFAVYDLFKNWEDLPDKIKMLYLSGLGFLFGAVFLNLPLDRLDWTTIAGIAPLGLVPLAFWFSEKLNYKVLAIMTTAGFVVMIGIVLASASNEPAFEWAEKSVVKSNLDNGKKLWLRGRMAEIAGEDSLALDFYERSVLEKTVDLSVYDAGRLWTYKDLAKTSNYFREGVIIDEPIPEAEYGLGFLSIYTGNLDFAVSVSREAARRLFDVYNNYSRLPHVFPAIELEKMFINYIRKDSLPHLNYPSYALFLYLNYNFDTKDIVKFLKLGRKRPFYKRLTSAYIKARKSKKSKGLLFINPPTELDGDESGKSEQEIQRETILNSIRLVNMALFKLGIVDPTFIRQKSGLVWKIYRGDAIEYIELVEFKTGVFLLVHAPIAVLPENLKDRAILNELLMRKNELSETGSSKFFIRGNSVSLGSIRSISNLESAEVYHLIDNVGSTADYYNDYLKELGFRTYVYKPKAKKAGSKKAVKPGQVQSTKQEQQKKES